MIKEEKKDQAMMALHSLLVFARALAYKLPSKELIGILDCAEYLPTLFVRDTDQTERFADMLREVSEKYSCHQPIVIFEKNNDAG